MDGPFTINDDSGWINVVVNHLRYRNKNGIVQVEICIQGKAASPSAWSTIGTLPTGVRPSAQKRLVGNAFNSVYVQFVIEANGTVLYESTHESNITGSIIYFI